MKSWDIEFLLNYEIWAFGWSPSIGLSYERPTIRWRHWTIKQPLLWVTSTCSIYLKFESCRHVGYRGESDRSHCRSTSLQPKLNIWFQGVGVWLQSLQMNFTAAQVEPLIWGGGLTAVTADEFHCSPSWTSDSGGGGGLTAVTADELHCSPSWTSDSWGIFVPPNHSVRSTGWPLVY